MIISRKSELLTAEEFKLVQQFHITDRSRTHVGCVCKKCGTLIEPTAKRAEFYLRDEQCRLVVKGFVHSHHIKEEIMSGTGRGRVVDITWRNVDRPTAASRAGSRK